MPGCYVNAAIPSAMYNCRVNEVEWIVANSFNFLGRFLATRNQQILLTGNSMLEKMVCST